jgi:hypothetical protein
MQKYLKVVKVAVGIGVCLIVGDLVGNRILYRRAMPPSGVTNITTCITWLGKPMGMLRVTTAGEQYYIIQGPPGRLAASGKAAYTFDARGRFVGWTPDMGDIYRPPVAFSPGARREEIGMDALPLTR